MTKADTEYFTTGTGRKIGYLYGKKPWESKPSLLLMHIIVEDGKGNAFAIYNAIPVLGKLNKWEMAREAERLEKRAEAVERGERDSPHVENLDIRSSATWRNFLKANPHFVKEHPEFLNDLATDGTDRH